MHHRLMLLFKDTFKDSYIHTCGSYWHEHSETKKSTYYTTLLDAAAFLVHHQQWWSENSILVVCNDVFVYVARADIPYVAHVTRHQGSSVDTFNVDTFRLKRDTRMLKIPLHYCRQPN